MKTLLFTMALAILAIGTVPTAPAYAHCGVCEASEKSHKMKPCEKCMKAGKTCNCAKKTQEMKPCEKCTKSGKTCGCGKKAKHDHMKKDKPCKVCKDHEKRWEMKKDMTKGKYNRTEKGDYQVQSRGPRQSNYND